MLFLQKFSIVTSYGVTHALESKSNFFSLVFSRLREKTIKINADKLYPVDGVCTLLTKCLHMLTLNYHLKDYNFKHDI